MKHADTASAPCRPLMLHVSSSYQSLFVPNTIRIPCISGLSYENYTAEWSAPNACFRMCTACAFECSDHDCFQHAESSTQDGMYTLSEMECMGSCVNAPMIAVADYSGPDARSFKYTYYEDLTPQDAVSIMDDLKAGKTPRVGARVAVMQHTDSVLYMQHHRPILSC